MLIALANVRPPATREDSVQIVLQAMEQAKREGAELLCFPECIVPGYRLWGTTLPIDASWLEEAWAKIDKQAEELGLAVILGTERIQEDNLLITARVTQAEGKCSGFQDKVQLDPSEEETYTAGTERKLFRCGELTFGIVICHEGWRYPETVRWAVRRGAQVVFHPHFEIVSDHAYRPTQFADPGNTFHEKAALCRAAENNCYFATVNCALPGATTTSALIDPEGTLITYQPHSEEGILVGKIEPLRATRKLADRFKSSGVNYREDI